MPHTTGMRIPRAAAPFVAIAVVCALFLAPASAQNAASTTMFDTPPPGTVMQRQRVYLSGEAMNSAYVAVASRTRLAPSANDRFGRVYQPYLTIYRQAAGGQARFRQIYQSPGPSDTLHLIPRSTRPSADVPYLPQSSLQIVGAAELTQTGVQQLVVTVHSAAADCGATTTSILGTDRLGRLAIVAAVQNPCALTAQIRSSSPDGLAFLALSGPYYAKDAPLCCPTKPQAAATLRYAGGTWSQRPRYFELTAPAR